MSPAGSALPPPRKLDREGELGFTLIELLVAVAILGMIVTAIVAVTITALHTLSGRGQAVADTSGAQLLTSYLVLDAQSADQVNPSSPCDGPALLELRWTDANGSSGTTDVVYAIQAAGTVDPAGAPDFQLTRKVFPVSSGGVCGAATEEAVIAPAVSNLAADTFASCTPSPCDDSAVSVSLNITAFSKEPKSGNYSPYKFVVSGTRRTK